MNEDKATRYHRSKRRASLLSLAWGIAVLTGSLAAGVSASLRSVAEAFAPAPASFWFRPVAVTLYVTLLMLVNATTDDVPFPLPATNPEHVWERLFDTVDDDLPEAVFAGTHAYQLVGRSVAVFRTRPCEGVRS